MLIFDQLNKRLNRHLAPASSLVAWRRGLSFCSAGLWWVAGRALLADIHYVRGPAQPVLAQRPRCPGPRGENSRPQRRGAGGKMFLFYNISLYLHDRGLESGWLWNEYVSFARRGPWPKLRLRRGIPLGHGPVSSPGPALRGIPKETRSRLSVAKPQRTS